MTLAGLALALLALLWGLLAHADFRVFNAGVDAGIANAIDCRNATCARAGSLLTITGGGGGQWTQVDGGLHHGAAVSIDAGLFAGSLTTRGSLRSGSAWFDGTVAVDAGVSIVGDTLMGGTLGIGAAAGAAKVRITGDTNGTTSHLTLEELDTITGACSGIAGCGISTFGSSTVTTNVYSPYWYGGAGGANGSFTIAGAPSADTSGRTALTLQARTHANGAVGTAKAFSWFNGPTELGYVAASGNLIWDATTLAVDSANDRVGVGTASPQEKLHVEYATGHVRVRATSGTGFSQYYAYDSGNTGRMSVGHGNSGTASPYTSSNFLWNNGVDFKFTNSSSAVQMSIAHATGLVTVTNNLVSNGLSTGNAYHNGSLGVDAGVNISGALNVEGATTLNGNTTLGNASGDTLTINASTCSAPNGLAITGPVTMTQSGTAIALDVTNSGTGTIGIRGTGANASVGVRGVGGPSGAGCSCQAGATSGQGLVATASSGSSSAGVLATGGGTNGRGVDGTGGGTSGVGVFGTGASTSGTGVHGQGGGSGAGVRGIGGATGIGGNFSGGSTSGIGVVGTGSNVSAGVRGVGGSSGGRGGEFVGSGNGDGLSVSVAAGSTGKAINMDATDGTGYAFYAIADQSSPVSAVGRFASQDADPSVASFGDFYVYSGNESFRGYSRSAWREFQMLGKDATDNSGSPGNTTINKPAGRFAVAAAATAVTVTNSYVVAASTVMVTKMDLDATCTDFKVVPGAGSFVLTVNAGCTAATKFMFSVE